MCSQDHCRIPTQSDYIPYLRCVDACCHCEDLSGGVSPAKPVTMGAVRARARLSGEPVDPHSQDTAWLGKHIGSLSGQMLFRLTSHLSLPRTLRERGVSRDETLSPKNRNVSGILTGNWKSEVHRSK